jgi:hypothetical protein
MKDNWNKNDWQGRSRENVETSYKVAGSSMFGCVCMMVGLVIYNLVVHGIKINTLILLKINADLMKSIFFLLMLNVSSQEVVVNNDNPIPTCSFRNGE